MRIDTLSIEINLQYLWFFISKRNHRERLRRIYGSLELKSTRKNVKNATYKFKTKKNLRDIARTRLKMMMKTFSETSVILIPKWNLRTALTKLNWNKMNLDFSVWKFQIWYERKKRYIRYRNESYSCIISISGGVFFICAIYPRSSWISSIPIDNNVVLHFLLAKS